MEISGIQITGKVIANIVTSKLDIAYIDGFKEMTVDTLKEGSWIVTEEDLKQIIMKKKGKSIAK